MTEIVDVSEAKKETKEVRPIEAIRQGLGLMSTQFASVLPKNISPQRFIRIAMTAVQDNTDLLMANRNTLYGACMKCALDGLLPDKREAAFVTFKDEVVYMPMVAGILKKLRNSGELVNITANCVFEEDDFEFYTDSEVGGDVLYHRPDVFSEDRGSLVGVYAIAKTTGGGVYIEVMNLKQIEKVRNASRAKTKGPWVDWFEEMAQKSVLRRLAKRLPMSSDSDGSIFDEETEEPVKAPVQLVEKQALAEPSTEAKPQAPRTTKSKAMEAMEKATQKTETQKEEEPI
jgi:recombination protein RecT